MNFRTSTDGVIAHCKQPRLDVEPSPLLNCSPAPRKVSEYLATGSARGNISLWQAALQSVEKQQKQGHGSDEQKLHHHSITT